MTNMNSKFFAAVGVLIGLIIGAGVLGIPYVVAKAGFWTGVIIIIFLGLTSLLMNLYLGEITLRTKGIHQLPGYVGKYLGKPGKYLMSIALLMTAYGALTSYLIGEGQAWGAIFHVNPFYPMIIFFLLMSIPVYFGLKLIKPLEIIINSLVVLVIAGIAFFALPSMSISNLSGFDAAKLIIPYGVVLFAFGGFAAIPDLRVILDKEKKLLKKCIIFGSLIPLILYLIFAASVVGVTGSQTTELATIGLGNIVGEHMVLLGNLFAAFAMSTSFLLLSLAILWLYNLDYKIQKNFAFILTLSFPLAIVLLNFASFVQIIGITGAIAGGVESILIILTHRAAQKNSQRKPEYSIKNRLWLSISLILIYLFGMFTLLL